MATMIKCPFCGGLVDAASKNCIHCGGPLKGKGEQPAPASSEASTCPACNASVQPGDIVCVKCGTNLLTGEKIDDEKQKQRAAPPRFAAVARVITVIAVVVILVAVAGILAALVVYLMRDPVGEARRLARAGNLGEASEVLQSHLQRTPDDLDAQFFLGKLYWQGQQYSRASEVFESVARQGGSHERDALLLSLLALERSPESENRQRLLALMGASVQQRYSHDTELLNLLALLRGVEGEYKGQRDAVQEALMLGGDVAPAMPGLAYALDADLERAEQALNRALQETGDDAAAMIALGVVHLIAGREETALKHFEETGEYHAGIDGLVKLQAGLLLMKRDEFGRALPLLTDARRLLPDDDRAEFFHALCLQENKLLDEAVVAFERISTGGGAYEGLALVQMAAAFMEQGNLDRAASMARRAGEAGVNTARQSTIQGRIYALQDEWPQAEQSYRRAVSMRPDYPAARLELGLLLINRGSIDAGLEELEQYLQLAQDDPQRMRANEIEVLVTQIRQTR